MLWHLGTLGKRPQLCGIRLLLENRASLRGKSHRNSMNLSRARPLLTLGKVYVRSDISKRAIKYSWLLNFASWDSCVFEREKEKKEFRMSPFSPSVLSIHSRKERVGSASRGFS